MTRLVDLTNEHLGGGDAYDLEQFKLACQRYMSTTGIDDDEAAVDAIWNDGDFVPMVQEYVPNYEPHGNE